MIVFALSLALAQASPSDDQFGMSAWTDCIVRERVIFAQSDEPIELLAIATLATCDDEEAAAFRATVATFRATADPIEARRLAKASIAEAKVALKEALIAYFVRKRLPSR